MSLSGAPASFPGNLPDGRKDRFFLVSIPSLSSSEESPLTLVFAFPMNVALSVSVRRDDESDRVSYFESSSFSVPAKLGGSVTCLSRLVSFLGALNLEAPSDIVGDGSLADFLMVWIMPTMWGTCMLSVFLDTGFKSIFSTLLETFAPFSFPIVDLRCCRSSSSGSSSESSSSSSESVRLGGFVSCSCWSAFFLISSIPE